MLNITWTPTRTPPALHSALRTLAADYPIREATGAVSDELALEFVSGPPERCVTRRRG